MSDPYLDRLVGMLWWHVSIPGNQEQKVSRECKASMVMITNISGNSTAGSKGEMSPV